MAGTPSAPGAQLLTTLTGQEQLDIIGSGPQATVVTVSTLLKAAGLVGLYSYTTNTATAGTTLTAANIYGGGIDETTLGLTGALGGAANAQLPTVAALVAVQPSFAIGTTYKLRIVNTSSGAFTWTITTNTGWTLTGAMTIPQNTWRDFYVTFTSATAATLQTVGTGTAP